MTWTEVRSRKTFVRLHPVRVAVLTEEAVVKIFNGKFKHVSLYKFRYMKGQSYEAYYLRDSQSTFENRELWVKKFHRSYKDYGKSIHVWADPFVKYQAIVVSFGKRSPHLHASLSPFHRKIFELSLSFGNAPLYL